MSLQHSAIRRIMAASLPRNSLRFRYAMSKPDKETLLKVYREVIGALEMAVRADDWETAARLHELSGELAWSMEKRLAEEAKLSEFMD